MSMMTDQRSGRTRLGALDLPGFMRLIGLVGLMAAVAALALSGCSVLGQTETRPAEAGFTIEDLPEVRPSDFTARYSQDAGMAPWSEWLSIEDGRAEYTVWMSEVTYVFDYEPSDRQLDDLYTAVHQGRFGEHLVIPFEEGEEVYDAGGTFYAVTVGDLSHRLGYSMEDLVLPDVDVSPLTALRQFVDLAATPDADQRLMIHYDPAINELYLEDLQVHFALADATFAIGEERWADEFEVGWSGGTQDVVVTISTGPPNGERATLIDQTVRIESGGVLELRRTVGDGIELRVS